MLFCFLSFLVLLFFCTCLSFMDVRDHIFVHLILSCLSNLKTSTDGITVGLLGSFYIWFVIVYLKSTLKFCAMRIFAKYFLSIWTGLLPFVKKIFEHNIESSLSQQKKLVEIKKPLKILQHLSVLESSYQWPRHRLDLGLIQTPTGSERSLFMIFLCILSCFSNLTENQLFSFSM